MRRRVMTGASPATSPLVAAALEAIDRFGLPDAGRVIHSGRNTIKVFDTPAGSVNVKSYRRPSLFNRVVYTLLRKPKGERAFIYPGKMKAAGVPTPAPLAYVEERRHGLMAGSWLATVQSPLTRRMYELGDRDMTDPSHRSLIEAFARFAARMHEAGVLHLDFSPGNILFDLVDGEWRFELVDVNRMKFGRVSVAAGCRNMARLWGQPEMFRLIARSYAAARGADADECLRLIHVAREKFWRCFSRRHKVKYTYRSIF